MPRYKPYKTLEPLIELGLNAELFIDQIVYDVSGINVREMLITYESEILQADKVTLESDIAGSWKFNHDRKKWERLVK